MVFKLEAANAGEFLLWVKWVLTNAKTVLFFCHHLEICKEKQRVGKTQGEKAVLVFDTTSAFNQGQHQIYKVGEEKV